MAAVGRSISNIAAAASRAATKLVNGESVACAVARRGELAGDRLAKATIGPRATLDAAAMARMEKAGALVVHGDEGFAGLVTDRGVVTYLSHGTRKPKKQHDPALLRARGLTGADVLRTGIRVCDVMKTNVPVVTRECAANDALLLMRAHGLSVLPLIDDASGELEGLVSLDDLLPEAPSVRKAGRLRTKWTFT